MTVRLLSVLQAQYFLLLLKHHPQNNGRARTYSSASAVIKIKNDNNPTLPSSNPHPHIPILAALEKALLRTDMKAFSLCKKAGVEIFWQS
jgi:hypothetical protein